MEDTPTQLFSGPTQWNGKSIRAQRNKRPFENAMSLRVGLRSNVYGH